MQHGNSANSANDESVLMSSWRSMFFFPARTDNFSWAVNENYFMKKDDPNI